MSKKRLPCLPDGSIDWDEVAREHHEWHDRRWRQIQEQRKTAYGRALLRTPVIVCAYGFQRLGDQNTYLPPKKESRKNG